MRQVVSNGSAIAHPDLGHSVHVEISGLEPSRDYYYEFQVGAERSRVGRTRTLPPAGSQVAQVRFAIAGCQKYEDGFYTAWRRLAEERFDCVYHYGDYIYERRVLRPAERALPAVRVHGDAAFERVIVNNAGIARIGLGRIEEGKADMAQVLQMWRASAQPLKWRRAPTTRKRTIRAPEALRTHPRERKRRDRRSRVALFARACAAG